MKEGSEIKEFNDLIMLFKQVLEGDSLQSIGYYSIMNFEQFKAAKLLLHTYLDRLIYEDFARVQSSYMLEGIFGEYNWIQKMNYSKMLVIGTLIQLLTAGNRLTNCISGIQNIERQKNSDWKILTKQLSVLSEDYRRIRNSFEHIEEMIAKGSPQDLESTFQFTRHGVFNYEYRGAKYSFDFSTAANSHISQLESLFYAFISMLKERKTM